MNNVLFIVKLFVILFIKFSNCAEFNFFEKRQLDELSQSTYVKIPIFENNNKLYLNVDVGNPPVKLALVLDMISPNSWLFKRADVFENNSTTYESQEVGTDLERPFINYVNSEVDFSGTLGHDNFTFFNLSSDVNLTELDSYIVSDYGFILADTSLDYNFTIDNRYPSDFAGGISLSRDNTYTIESFSLLKQLKHSKLISSYEDVKIVRKETPHIQIGKIGKPATNNTSFCNLFKYDYQLSNLWACNISHIFFGNTTDITKYEENFVDNKMSLFDSVVMFDTVYDKILFPSNLNLVHKLINTSLTNNTNSTNIVDYFSNQILKNKNCEYKNTSNILYTTFICKNVYTNQNEFFDTFEFKDFSFILNGFAYTMKIEELFKIDKNEYEFQIDFYTSNNYGGSFVTVGNNFLKKFDSISFSVSESRVTFEGGNFVDLSKFTKDLVEVQPLFSFFLLSVICVIFLILIVLLVPYLIYRQRKRAMMEKLQYDIIYKKMDDITRELGK